MALLSSAPSTLTQQPAILIVDDREANLLALESLLESCNAKIYTATSGNEALSLLLELSFSLVLLDVQMPDMDGFEVAEIMRSNPQTQSIPIIFVTAISTEKDYIFKGYESGAVDYLTKPIEPVVLNSKVKVFLELWTEKNKLISALTDLEEANQKIKLQHDKLQELAIRDHLTGLYHRRWFDEVSIKEVAHAVRHKIHLSIAMIDIDYFKKVNDSYGHSTGDEVLIQVSKILHDSIREDDTLFRYGGEEFVILFPHTCHAAAVATCERVRQNVKKHNFIYNDVSLNLSVSIGIAELLELEQQVVSSLIENADEQLYLAKNKGRDQVSSSLLQTTSIMTHGPCSGKNANNSTKRSKKNAG